MIQNGGKMRLNFVVIILVVLSNIGAVDFNVPVEIANSGQNYFDQNGFIDDVNSDGSPDVIFYDDYNGPYWAEDTNGDGFPDTKHHVGNFTQMLSSLDYIDMNNDGEKDIIVNFEADTNLYIFYGHGTGNFSLNDMDILDSGVYKDGLILIHDFNHDGIQDIYTSGGSCKYFYKTQAWSQFILVDLQNGTSQHRYVKSSCLADINNDGYMDIVGFWSYDEPYSWQEFDPATNSFIHHYLPLWFRGVSSGITPIDGNTDGLIDLLVYEDSLNACVLYENDATQSFSNSSILINNVGNVRNIYKCDLNSDGLEDLVIQTDWKIANIYLNNGNGFNYITDIYGTGDYLWFKDLDGDGYKEIVTESENDVFKVFNNSNGSFSNDDVRISSFRNTDRLSIRESDNLTFISCSHFYNFNYLMLDDGIADLSNIQAPSVSVGEINKSDCADIDGNGQLDYVYAINFYDNSYTKNLILSLNGQNMILENSNYRGGRGLMFADLDDDGDSDLVDFGIEYTHFYNYINGTLIDSVVIDTDDLGFVFEGSKSKYIDMDNDGIRDIVYTGSNNQLFWIKNNGSFNFGESELLTTISSDIIAFTDLNLDGRIDMLVRDDFAPNHLLVRYGEGNDYNFSFSQSADTLLLPGDITELELGDYNNDGVDDIAVNCFYHDNHGHSSSVSVAINPVIDNNWEVVSLLNISDTEIRMAGADLDENGTDDIAYVDNSTGEIKVLYNNPLIGIKENNDLSFCNTQLLGNYPNPFNPETKISYSMANSGNAELTIYNIKGQRVKTLVNDHVEAGEHSIIWNGKDEKDSDVSSGVYFYRLKTADGVQNKKMLLLK